MFFTIPSIEDIDQPALTERLQRKLDNKTKPIGSLGDLERLAMQIAITLGTESPQLQSPQLIVFAADHGLAQQGVSAYPSDVTWQMVANFLSGGAAVSVLARQHGICLHVADCGVSHNFDPRHGLLRYKIAHGTRDALLTQAMSLEQCHQALANGVDLIKNLPGNALLLGEMGIGNTSAAALLMSRLLGLDIADCTGAGTGLDAGAIEHKTQILRQVLLRHDQAHEPLDALAAMGGFEISTMVGAVLRAAVERRVIVVDGFIASAAVLVACKLQPFVVQRCIFAHQSAERGHAIMLQHLGARPLLRLDLRLGEGSGAALAWPLLVSACEVLNNMASFESAGVARQVPVDQEKHKPNASP